MQVGRQPHVRGRWLEQQLGAFPRQRIARALGQAQRQDGRAQAPGQHPARQIAQHLIHAFLDARVALLHAPPHQRQVIVLAAFVLPALEHGGKQIEFGQDVPQARGDHFAALQATAQLRQRGVGQQREPRGIAAQPAVMPGCRPRGRRGRHRSAGPGPADGAQGVDAGVPQVAPEDVVKDFDATLFVGIAQSQDFRHQIGMGADGALSEDDEVARQDVGALDRDGDGHRAVQRPQIIAGAVHDAAAGMHVHGVVDRAAHALGCVILHDARHDGGLHVLVQRGARQAPGGLHQIGVARQAGQFFLHALEFADGNAELVPHAGIHAGRVRAHHRGGGRQRGQRNAAPRRQRAHQHLPALPGALGTSDQGVQRHEHVAPLVGPVLKDLHGRQMTPADLHAGRLGGHQRHGDADIPWLAQNAFRIRHLERQAQHGGHGPQRDVALVPVQPDADQLTAIDHLPAHDAGVHHGCRIRPGLGAGQSETRHLAAVRQPGQPVIALGGRAELHQQFARPQRVRDHDGDARRDRIRGNAAHHLGMGIGGKSQPAIAARDDHAEKALRLEKGPDVRRQVPPVPGDVPFVQHAAQLRHRAIDEALLVRSQRGGRHAEQLAPIGVAGEQIRIPPGVAGFDGLALGGRHGRQRFARPAVRGFRNAAPAPGVEIHESPCYGYKTYRGKVPELTAAGQAGGCRLCDNGRRRAGAQSIAVRARPHA
ncbi:hypothetical protein D3C87_595100 [compost metagenome]